MPRKKRPKSERLRRSRALRFGFLRPARRLAGGAARTGRASAWRGASSAEFGEFAGRRLAELRLYSLASLTPAMPSPALPSGRRCQRQICLFEERRVVRNVPTGRPEPSLRSYNRRTASTRADQPANAMHPISRTCPAIHVASGAARCKPFPRPPIELHVQLIQRENPRIERGIGGVRSVDLFMVFRAGGSIGAIDDRAAPGPRRCDR